MVLLSGEAGIGKSRLSEALREQILDEPHTRLRYYCSPFYVNSPLYPMIQQVERVAGLGRDDDAAQKLDKLEALLGRSTDALAAVVPLLAALWSIPVGERYPPLELSPERQREETLAMLLEQLARPRGAAAGPHGVRGSALDRSDLARIARSGGRARAGPPAAGGFHLSAGVSPELDRAAARHRHGAQSPRPAPRCGDGRDGCEESVADGSPRSDRDQDRRCALVRRGADQDRAGIGSAGGCRRTLRARRPVATARDSLVIARFPPRPPRSPGADQGGGADRRGHRPRIFPSADCRGRTPWARPT